MARNVVSLLLFFFFLSLQVVSQEREKVNPVFIDSAQAVPSSPLSTKRKLIPASKEYKLVNPRNRGINKVVPGKGFPKTMDHTRQAKFGEIQTKAPILSFDVASSRTTPTDPTGAVGPNHYVNAWNSAFSIHDKDGNQLVPPVSLSSLGGEFGNETLGDPIVLYDHFADRFLITQFSDTPNSFLVAISRGPNPVTDGWYTYRFSTNNEFPDYPKISVWSDGYYVTTNKNTFIPTDNYPNANQTVYVFERDAMLLGETASFVAFPLPGININRFYSPAGFNAMGEVMPPPGNAPIIYMQDDAWEGVSVDHLKIWTINVNWVVPAASTIQEFQELGPAEGVSPFIATFDGGSFTNLEQPGNPDDVDVLQATIMYMTQFRSFETHNSVVLNFVVDVDPSPAEHAGIRWYELRQERGSLPWRVHQEGTYAPDKAHRFCGSIGMDKFGNIGLGFTVLFDSPVDPIYPSIRYTGRYESDPLGIMTLAETSIVDGDSPDPSSRYGDYAHLTVDPVDDVTFWHNAEYFVGITRVNRVGVFRLAPSQGNDVGITELIAPQDATLSNAEAVTVTIRNFGSNPQSNIPVSYSVDGGPVVTEVFTGTLNPTSSVNYTFNATADLGEELQTYEITAATALAGDENIENDTLSTEVTHLYPVDVGVISIDSPSTDLNLASEQITVTIANFGGEPQSNIPVIYTLENNIPVREIFPGTIEVGETAVYTFTRTANLSRLGRFDLYSETELEGDRIPENDGSSKSIANLSCIPSESDCTSFGDGIFSFQLEEILNENIPCVDGYGDFIQFFTYLDRAQGTYVVRVKTLFDSDVNERFSLWIDLNDNGFFDDVERLITSEIIPSASVWHSYEFTLPEDAPLGQHLMRVRGGDISFEGDLNDPCSDMEYGSTHDYSVVIIDSNLELDDFLLNEAELVVSAQGNDIYSVFLETDMVEPLRITVHDLLGQKLLENQVYNTGDGYLYTFDMSFAATGVYLLRIGTREVGKVKRFIVK